MGYRLTTVDDYMERSIRDSHQLINYLKRCDNDTQQLITTWNVVIETNNVDHY